MAQLGGFLGALGQAFSGYGQDQQLRFQHEQEATKLQMAQAAASQAAQMHQAQMRDYDAQAQARTAMAAEAANKMEANQRAYGAIQQVAPDHPLAAQPFSSGIDYVSPLQEAIKERQEGAKRAAADKDADAKIQQTAAGLVGIPGPDGRPLNQQQAMAIARNPALATSLIAPKPPAEVKDHWQSAGVDPATGAPLLFNTLTGETKQGGGIKGSASAQGQTAQRAIQAAAPVLPAMEEYENGVLSGKYTAPSSIKRGMAAAANTTSQSPMSQMIGGLAGSALSDNDQKYADYMRNSQIVGDAAAAAGGRFSNARIGLEGSLASMRQGDEKSASMIRTIQQRRRAMLNESAKRYGVDPDAQPAQPAAPYAKSVLDRFGIKPTTP